MFLLKEKFGVYAAFDYFEFNNGWDLLAPYFHPSNLLRGQV